VLQSTRNSVRNVSGPVEIKADLPDVKSFGLVSPVPTMPTSQSQQQLQSPSKFMQDPFRRQLGPGQPPLGSSLPPGHPLNMPHSSNDVQILAESFSLHHQLQQLQQQQLQQMERQLHQQQQQQQQQLPLQSSSGGHGPQQQQMSPASSRYLLVDP
jgi:hypothetical protein